MFLLITQVLPEGGKQQSVLVNADLLESVLPFSTRVGAKLTLKMTSGHEIEIAESMGQFLELLRDKGT